MYICCEGQPGGISPVYELCISVVRGSQEVYLYGCGEVARLKKVDEGPG